MAADPTLGSDRHLRTGKRRSRPFGAWVKRLAGFRADHESGRSRSLGRSLSRRHGRDSEIASLPKDPGPSHEDTRHVAPASKPRSIKSTAHTMRTNPDTIDSDHAPSKAGTSLTAAGALSSYSGGGGGAGSTFSSPAPSERSIATTLTTVQSAAPSQFLTAPMAHPAALSSMPSPSTTGGPASATILTDNASVMTLASSSKRRHRRSCDTNASMRALAPASMYGESKESLTLSVLSGNMADQASLTGSVNNPLGRASAPPGSAVTAERASIISSSGNAPVLSSERNSTYRAAGADDGRSTRSVRTGHGRNDSLTKSIGSTFVEPARPGSRDIGRDKMDRKTSTISRRGQPDDVLDDV